MKDDEIGAILSCLPPAEAVHALVDLANLRGGPDNITVIIARVLGPQIAQNSGSDSSGRFGAGNIEPIHPMTWVVMGVAALAAVGMLAMGHPWIALLALISTAVTVAAALMQRYGGANQRFQRESRRLGRGPHVACPCAPNAELFARLNEIIQQLRDAATKENWSIDWAPFDKILAQTSLAAQTNNFVDATRNSLRAISFLMAQLRQQRSAGSDSSVI